MIENRLKGFRDFLPCEKRKRDFVKSKIEEVFVKYAFQPIETPTLESAHLLLGKYGTEANNLVYTFKDHGDREIGLRYDQTVPTARFLNENLNVLPKFFRRYQIQNVFRAEKPQKGRYREFTQCDTDIFGANEGVADAEIIVCTYDVFKNIGFGDVEITINDRRSLVDAIKPFATETVNVLSVIQTIDKLDKMSKKDVLLELEKKGLSKESADLCLETVFNIKPSTELKEIINFAISLGIPEKSIVFVPFLARGLDYYTGMIFEAKVKGEKSSLCGGGRYDHLIEDLGNRSIPAVGVGLGFDRIVEIAEEKGLVVLDSSKDVL